MEDIDEMPKMLSARMFKVWSAYLYKYKFLHLGWKGACCIWSPESEQPVLSRFVFKTNSHKWSSATSCVPILADLSLKTSALICRAKKVIRTSLSWIDTKICHLQKGMRFLTLPWNVKQFSSSIAPFVWTKNSTKGLKKMTFLLKKWMEKSSNSWKKSY